MASPFAVRSAHVAVSSALPEQAPASRTQRARSTFRGTSFESAFERYVTATRNHDSLLLRIELSGFRSVEEQWGMKRTDEARDELVQRAIAAAGPLALAGRVGTNELAVVIPLVPDSRAPEEQLATSRAALEVEYEGCGTITANVGGVRFDCDLRDPAEIKRRAGMALHRATGSRSGRTVLYDAELRAEWDARAGLLAEIRQGAAAGEFVLHYQPICDVDGRCRGFEALMRWQHPERGLLAPYHFLAAFEHPSLSVVLGDVAIRTAVAQMRTWRDAGVDFGYVAVNLATEQFAVGDLAQRLHEVLQEYGIEPSCLMLEVTESVYLDRDADRIVATLRGLRALGVRVALDDFGTGFASLSHLKTLPIDRLKIDRAFVKGLQERTIDAAIVGAMVLLGKSLGVEVVAEGVETAAELAALCALGCERIQGFLFARPLDPDAAARFVAAR